MFRVPAEYQNSQWRPESVSALNSDGSFEVFIWKKDFPISAPGCNGDWIILRMPGTVGDADVATKVAEKKRLWERLQQMYQTKESSVQVVIELSEYIRVVEPTVPKIELEYCNVFFRCAYGAYVPYVGELKSPNPVPQPQATIDPELKWLTAALDAAKTQTDMNLASKKISEFWDAKLASVESRIAQKLDDGQQKAFADSKARWRDYRTQEIKFRSDSFADGSIRPLIVNESYSEITEHRVAELESLWVSTLEPTR